MPITLNGTTGITTDGGYTGDGIAFADGTPSNTLVTTTGGNVGIGTTSPNSAAVNRALTINGSSNSIVELNYDGTRGAYLFSNSFNTVLSAVQSGAVLMFNTNDTERMRIDSSGNLLFNSGYGSVATAYGCRAWVNFNGTGTVAIRSSGNVTSITDNGVGLYTLNFTNAMPDTNYCFTSGSIGDNGNPYVAGWLTSGSYSTTALSLAMCRAGLGGYQDASIVNVSIFR
jgi:hypothetical protein